MPLGDMSVAILALVLVTQCPPFSLVLFSSRLCYLPIFRMAAAKREPSVIKENYWKSVNVNAQLVPWTQ